jgi:hypothetical protein
MSYQQTGQMSLPHSKYEMLRMALGMIVDHGTKWGACSTAAPFFVGIGYNETILLQ